MSLKQKFRDIKKLPDWVFFLPAKLISLMKFLMRTEVVDPFGEIAKKSPPAITVTWHNRLLFFPVMFEKWEREHTVAVISASRDGQYIADLCKQWGVGSVRGSSSRKAVQVLTGAMKSILQKKMYVAFTPDGPRGPIYTMSRGPVFLASETGVRVLPVAVNYSSYWELKSWDRFRIPKPWAKITLRVGEGIFIPKDLSEEDIKKYQEELRRRLNEVSEVKEEETK